MDRSKLKAWFAGKPKSWAVAIAARAALRVVPLFAQKDKAHSDRDRRLLLTVFRATAAPWIYSGYSAHSEAAARAARAAEAEAARAAAASYNAFAAFAAARSAAAVYTTFAAEAATEAAGAAEVIYAAFSDDAALWREIELDISLFASTSNLTDDTAARLAHSRLWKQRPGSIAERWNNVKSDFLRTVADEEALGMGRHLEGAERWRVKELEAEDWGVWTEWYDRRLLGDPPNEALEIERVASPAIPWAQGAKLVNRALREIERKHLALATYLPERIERDAETGLHRVAPDPARHPQELAVAVSKVRRSISDIRAASVGNNLYGELGTGLNRLESDLDAHANEPLGLHDAFIRMVKVIGKKIDAGHLPRGDELIEALHDDLANGAADIRGSDKTINAAISRRAGIKLLAASEDQMRDGDLATEAKAAASVPELARPMREDWGVLRAVREGAPVDEDEAKAAVQRYISRSTRIDETATRETLLQKGAEFGDRIDKIDKGSRAAARMFGLFLNLLG